MKVTGKPKAEGECAIEQINLFIDSSVFPRFELLPILPRFSLCYTFPGFSRQDGPLRLLHKCNAVASSVRLRRSLFPENEAVAILVILSVNFICNHFFGL